MQPVKEECVNEREREMTARAAPCKRTGTRVCSHVADLGDTWRQDARDAKDAKRQRQADAADIFTARWRRQIDIEAAEPCTL